MKQENKLHYVYIVECADGTYYTGYTTSVERRLNEHNYSFKRGAKYTRSRRPVTLIHQETYPTRSQALKREHAIKKLSRKKKQQIITESTGGKK
mgnify:CR=1 FL=1|jgi:putative endonuclease